MATTLNLNFVPQAIKDRIERDYPTYPTLAGLAEELGITLSRMCNIAHAMRVRRSMEARSRNASIAASTHRHRFPDLNVNQLTH